MSLNVLIVDAEGLGLDFALRCADAGHTVRWFRPSKRGTKVGQGFHGITIVRDWREHMAWAKQGLILTTGNARYIRELDQFRALGFKIFAPTERSAKLEIDRGFGMEEMQKAGIAIPPYEQFKSLKEAESFARKSDKAWVFKTLGSEEDKALSYVASDPADMVGWLQRQQKLGMTLKGPCMLQEKIDMLAEVGVSGWFGPEGFLPEKWQVCFEHKKLMNGEIGPNTGEQGCYSADTEVLTRSGWKVWPHVSRQDELATLVDGFLTFERPSVVVSYDSMGSMVSWQNRSIDILVTPNHNMFVAGQSSTRLKSPKFKFVQADRCTESQYLLARTAGWDGASPEARSFSGKTWHTGIGRRQTEEATVSFGEWCKFLGLWFAEGCASRSNAIDIAQSHPKKAAAAESIIAATALRFTRRKNGFRVYCAQVGRELQRYGRSYEKRVPAYIKDAAPKDIAAFLDGFALGDAHTQPNGSRVFYTSNGGLADDLQELMLKCGRLGIIKKVKPKKTNGKIRGREIFQRRQAYAVYERARKITGWLDIRDRKIVPYEGKVYCATVSSHVLFVRRNGKPVWCGNTVCQYVETDKMADEMLKPMEAYLLKAGHRGDFAIGCGIDSKGKAWPLEFTARLGWPAFYIQIASHKGDPAQWMRDLLDGKDTLKVSRDVGIGVVMAQPRYPYNDSEPKEVEGVPISGCDEVWDDLHPAEMMTGRGPMMKDGKVEDGPICQTAGEYVLIMTALGDTVEKARNRVYRSIDKVSFPNSIFRTDIGCKLEASLPKLHGFGYAREMEFS